MTKERAPLSFPQAMSLVAGSIGHAAAAQLAGKSERMIYHWSDPDGSARPDIDLCIAFDAAYLAAGGDSAPFLETYQHQLEVNVSALTACRRELSAEIALAARESGEAIAATIAITSTNASPRDVHRALAEVEQAQTRFAVLMRRLTSFLPFGVGPGAGKPGGPQT